jgi:HSP90 family molecular chaperone
MANKSLNHQETLIEYIPLKVSAGVLLQIGAGIYGSVAAAFKELVSNAFDADASALTILTDYPRFEEIKIVDDGSGMSEKRFKQAMQMIGTSLKGTIDPIRVTPKYKRPIIGRLGIGLMALSQLCNKAIIESTVKGEASKFVAELDFTVNQSQEAAQLDVFRLGHRFAHCGKGGVRGVRGKALVVTTSVV